MTVNTKDNKSNLDDEFQNGLKGSQWQDKLSQISKGVKKATRLTLMGSAPNMLRGQPSRMSMDLDVWKTSSCYDRDDLKQAVESAGLLFNPTEEAPTKPYIQIIEAGICQLGRFKTQDIENLETMGNLSLEAPPIENLIASKLLRAEAKDLEDINWMISKYQPNISKIKEVIKSFPPEHKEKALENMVYLEVICNSSLPAKPKVKFSTSRDLGCSPSISE